MVEYITIQSADGKAKKKIRKSEYALYAQSGWKEVKKEQAATTGAYSSPYTSTVNK